MYTITTIYTFFHSYSFSRLLILITIIVKCIIQVNVQFMLSYCEMNVLDGGNSKRKMVEKGKKNEEIHNLPLL